MTETFNGIKSDLKKLKHRLILWLFKKLVGKQTLKSPTAVLWDMIDEENNHGSMQVTSEWGPGEFVPNCIKIEALEEAIDRINKECFGAIP